MINVAPDMQEQYTNTIDLEKSNKYIYTDEKL